MHTLSFFSALALPVFLVNGLTIKVTENDATVAQVGEKPSIVDTAFKPKYSIFGCYTDQSFPRGLDGKNQMTANVDVDTCATFCVNFKYFGVEDGKSSALQLFCLLLLSLHAALRMPFFI